jgi:hypothetical protein
MIITSVTSVYSGRPQAASLWPLVLWRRKQGLGATSKSISAAHVSVQDFTTTTFRARIMHDDRFRLRYVGRGFIVKDAAETTKRATTLSIRTNHQRGAPRDVVFVGKRSQWVISRFKPVDIQILHRS